MENSSNKENVSAPQTKDSDDKVNVSTPPADKSQDSQDNYHFMVESPPPIPIKGLEFLLEVIF